MSDNKAVNLGVTHTDGREIFELRHTIMVENREAPAARPIKKKEISKIDNESSDQEPLPLFNEDSGVVKQKWRILSKVKTWPNTGYWEPQEIDYSAAPDEVLQQMIPLIDVQPDLRWDHSYSTKDIAGWVENAEWEEIGDIEAGVNAWVAADPEYDPKAAIGLRKGIIRSGSVGINARVVKSHPDMPTDKFVTMQGKIIDNQEVRWIPVEITNVEHMALVPYRLGADPNAGVREPQKRSNYSKAVNNTESPKLKKQGGQPMTDWAEKYADICNTLGVDFAVDEDAASAKQITQAVVSKLLNLKESHKQLISIQQGLYECEKHLLDADETGLKSDEIVRRLPEKLRYSEHGKKFLDFQKTEAIRWFDMATVSPDADMSENDKRIRSRIHNSVDLEFIEEQLNLYKDVANGRFGPDRSSVKDEIPKDIPKPVTNTKNSDVDRIFGGK